MPSRDGYGKTASRKRARDDEDSDLNRSARKKGPRRDDYESDSEADDRRSKKRKQKSESSKAKSIAGERKGASGEIYWDLPDKRRLTVSDFKGKTYIGIREFYEQDGELKPGKRGISLTVDQFQQAYLLMPNVATYLRANGADLSRLEEADEHERRREKESRKKREREQLSATLTSSPSRPRTDHASDENGFKSRGQSEADVPPTSRGSLHNGAADNGRPRIKSEEKVLDSDRDLALYEIAAAENGDHVKRELTPPLSMRDDRRRSAGAESEDEEEVVRRLKKRDQKRRRMNYEETSDED